MFTEGGGVSLIEFPEGGPYVILASVSFWPLLGPVYTPDRPCVHTRPPGTGTMWVHLPGTMWVHLRKGPSTDLDRSRSRVNGQD